MSARCPVLPESGNVLRQFLANAAIATSRGLTRWDCGRGGRVPASLPGGDTGKFCGSVGWSRRIETRQRHRQYSRRQDRTQYGICLEPPVEFARAFQIVPPEVVSHDDPPRRTVVSRDRNILMAACTNSGALFQPYCEGRRIWFRRTRRHGKEPLEWLGLRERAPP